MARDPKSSYYDAGGIEVLDVIRAKLTPEQFQGYLLGNIVKYSLRANFKGQMDRDLEKIQQYVKELVDSDLNKIHQYVKELAADKAEVLEAPCVTREVIKAVSSNKFVPAPIKAEDYPLHPDYIKWGGL